MGNIRIFVKKEIKEILKSKRLMMVVLFALVYGLLLNIVSTMPGSTPLIAMDIERALMSVNLFVCGLCADIIYITMIEEVYYGTFDMLCLGTLGKRGIVFFKCMVPVSLSIIILVFSCGINNIAALFISKLYVFNICDVGYWIMAFVAAMGCGFFEFFRCIGSKKDKPGENNYAVLLLCTIYVILYYHARTIGCVMICIIAILITFAMYVLAMWKMENKASVRRDNTRRWHVKIKDGNYIFAIISRELNKICKNKIALLKLIYLLVMALWFICGIGGEITKDIMMLIVIYSFALTFSGNIYYNSIKLEVYEDMSEILFIAGMDKKKNYRISLLVSLILGLICGVILILTCNLCGFLCHEEFGAIIYLIYYLFILFISFYVAYVCVIKKLESPRDEQIVKKYINVISLVIYIIFFIIVKIVF